MHQKSRTRVVKLSTKEIKQRTKTKEKVEIRFIGMPRCGINCIAKWMLMHFQGYSFHSSKPLPVARKDKQYYKKLTDKLVSNKKNLVSRNQGKRLCVSFGWHNLCPSVCIKTPSIFPKRINVIVLRNPFNQFASIEKTRNIWTKDSLTAREYIELRSMWLAQAGYFSKKYSLWDGKLLRILYDKWVSDPNYQKEILHILGDEFEEVNLDLSKIQTPTPFDNTKVNKRFDQMKDSNPMKAMSRDNILKKLTQNIFG